MPPKNVYRTITLSIITSTFLLTGCAVKPNVITPKQLHDDVVSSIQVIDEMNVPIEKPITLDEAIDRAIKNNLEQKMKVMDSVLAEQKLDAATYDTLPELATKVGYSARDKYSASASTYFKDGEPQPLSDPVSYYVSQDKTNNTVGASFSWNILDFGLSYVRAKQQSDKYLISKENEKKAKYNLTQAVREAYYKAVSADELLSRLAPIIKKTQDAWNDSADINKLKLDSPLKIYSYQRELLEVVRSLNTLEESLSQSKIELARLMGLKPGAKFELAEKIRTKYNLPKINIPVNELEQIALENRPELQESRYQIRISEEELTAVKLKLLPGINLNAGYNYDDSKYLLNNNWMSYGANASWNLFSVFSVNQNTKIAKTSLELAKLQKTALSVAVIGQVHLSMIDLAQAKKEYEVSEQYANISKHIFDIIQVQTALNVNGQLSLIKEELNYLVANLKLSSSYAKVQNAYGKVIMSVGKPELFEEVKQEQQQTHTIQNTPALNFNETVTKISDELKQPVQEVKKIEQEVKVQQEIKSVQPEVKHVDAEVKVEKQPAQEVKAEVAKEPEVVKPQEEIKPVEKAKPVSQDTQQKSPIVQTSPITLFESTNNSSNELAAKYIVTNEYSNIRTKPSMHAPIVRYTNKGEILKVDEYKNNWYKVEDKWFKVNGGYIHKNMVELMPDNYKPQNITQTLDASRIYAQVKKDANLREKPLNSSSVVKHLIKGEMIEIIKKDKNWYQTPDGYIYERYIQVIDNR